jgi:hypothetical protein
MASEGAETGAGNGSLSHDGARLPAPVLHAVCEAALCVEVRPVRPVKATSLGPTNNQFTFAWGRLKDGRGELIKRFAGDAMGSVNAHGHTTVRQGSLCFTGKAMSEPEWYARMFRSS